MYFLVTRIHPLLNRALALLGAFIAVCAFVYGFLLLEAVGHTAARSQAEGAIRSLSSELGELQSQYLNQTKEVTLSLATELGFVEPQETSVIFMSANALSLNYTNVPTQ